MRIVSLEDVSFRYNEMDQWILQEINVAIQQAEWVSVLGPNGSGKSTLARLLNGLLLPEKGTVWVDGNITSSEEGRQIIRRSAGMVFQNPDHQFVAPTVRDDLAFGMENAGIDRETMIARINQVAWQTGVESFLDAEPHRLSGGQKQRAAIAGALVLQPKLLLLDEATSMLDPNGRKEVLATVQGLNREEGITIVSITHDLREAFLADRILYLEKGKLIQDIPADQLLHQLSWLEEKDVPLPYEFALLEILRSRDSKHATVVEKYIRKGLAL
ncbi:energy-coupling factor transporter ATPase [Bacillus piscicola]|uniref:energy-coupling factor transporter ATPase n=1 Tax=Bacillus piscicola TaxID=1632684 RepID=UPI001F08C65C|nr:energy-coupling factor transporter ATPase [Bacillus piscicola]